MAEAKEMPPFWLQPNTGPHCRRRRSQFSSMFLNSVPLRVILLVIAFIFVFHVVPSFLFFSSHVLAPRSIKKGWDSLNLVLVLFAIVCGFLRRNNNDNNRINDHEGASYYGDRHVTNVQQDAQPSYPSTPRRWYDHCHDLKALVSLNRLRSFRSYPDLRLESSWLANDEQPSEQPRRFHDDTHLNSHRFPSSDQLHHDHHRRQEQQQEPKKEEEEEELNFKNSSVPPPSPPPPTISSASLTRGSKIEAKNVAPPPLESRTKATQVAPVTSHDDKRLKQVKTSRLKSMEENVDSGNASPLIPIPPPPPPPWVMVVSDHVKVASFNSSRSGSLDLESLEDPSDEESSSPMATAVYGGGADIVTMPLSCPSPDVNTEAENFIAKVRAGWRS